jgi:hypothetical protein
MTLVSSVRDTRCLLMMLESSFIIQATGSLISYQFTAWSFSFKFWLCSCFTHIIAFLFSFWCSVYFPALRLFLNFLAEDPVLISDYVWAEGIFQHSSLFYRIWLTFWVLRFVPGFLAEAPIPILMMFMLKTDNQFSV